LRFDLEMHPHQVAAFPSARIRIFDWKKSARDPIAARKSLRKGHRRERTICAHGWPLANMVDLQI